ncbi:MAG: SCP2 sterol-binding domain-containing protein [Firmicutes bacterium]|nr:SCP2 sterol-binding domain-containing protein [Bacillota bacterium]
MPFFRDADDVYDLLGGLFRQGREHPNLGPKVAASRILIQFQYREPDAVITINAKNPQEPPFDVILGPTDIKPDVTMTMKADVAHEFWLGKVNLLTALARRQIVAQGPVSVAIKLVPVLGPAFSLYRQYLEQKGRQP